MFFTVYQKDLHRGIQIVQRAVPTRSTLPILNGIYLEANKEKGLHLISNNLEIGIEYWVNADIKEEGTIIIPAEQFINIVRELPPADIEIKVDLERFELELNCLSSNYKLKGFQADEFPELPSVEGKQSLTVPGNTFKNILEEVRFSVSTDQTQPSLTGALMVVKPDSMKMVATNTYRLAFSQVELTEGLEEEFKAILPGGTLNELAHLLRGDEEEKVEILIDNNYLCFNFNDIVLVSRLIEGKFPNYEQVIPDEHKTRITVDRNELTRTVRRVSLIAKLDSNVISVTANKDQMFIDSLNSDTGQAHEELEIELDGEEQRIDIDAGYLLDVLKILSDEVVTLELIGPVNPLTVKKETGNDFIYLIMPVRPGS